LSELLREPRKKNARHAAGTRIRATLRSEHLTDIQSVTGANKGDEHKLFLLTSIRVACCRVRLLAHEMNEVGVCLSQGIITPEAALSWLHEIGGQTYLTFAPTEGDADGR
jgi:hypothetical protein